ncbi:MAG TPA: hypothetical protein VMS43_01160 [Allosphingosinicella sp.]|nr:hypothetical protein [Allosphingosinicella sp.]
MTHVSSFDTDTFDGIDMSELDLLDIEIVQTANIAGLPETGASCCPSTLCSSCCIDIT